LEIALKGALEFEDDWDCCVHCCVRDFNLVTEGSLLLVFSFLCFLR